MYSNMLITLGLLCTSMAKAQSQEDKDTYPDYADAFARYNVTWEPIKVQTEDGYTLTMFHITGNSETGPYEITKNAVLMQHGMGGSGMSWNSEGIISHDEPFAYKLARMGFDVYFANNRGTRYS